MKSTFMCKECIVVLSPQSKICRQLAIKAVMDGGKIPSWDT
jgi:hypothetical protein